MTFLARRDLVHVVVVVTNSVASILFDSMNLQRVRNACISSPLGTNGCVDMQSDPIDESWWQSKL